MFLTYVPMFVMMILRILVPVTNTQSVGVIYEDVNVKLKSDASLVVLKQTDRESNLKFVMAIQNLCFWTQIKKRSLMIYTEPKAESVINKSLNSLSDQELLKLKQMCQDGLKCIAVDHLIVLTQQFMQMTDDSKTLVRTAITKITKVLTQYTSEYHEDTYQYEEVTDKDDTTKVYSCVTKILKDNEELCLVKSNNFVSSNVSSYSSTNSNAYMTACGSINKISDGSSNKDSGSISNKDPDSSLNKNSDDKSYDNSDESVRNDKANTVIINEGDLNFGKINNFSVNNGTMNSATIKLDSSETSDDNNKLPNVLIGANLEHSTPALDNTSTSQNDTQNDDGSSQDKCAQTNSSPETVVPADSYFNQIESSENVKEETQDHINRSEYRTIGCQTDIQNHDSTNPNITSNNVDGDLSSTSDKSDATINTTDNSANNTNTSQKAKKPINNFAILNNANDSILSKNDQSCDMVSEGHHNNSSIVKGCVDDGDLNNGLMQSVKLNRGVKNNGLVTKAKAKHSIMNVGTVNNGPSNYGTINGLTNKGNFMWTDNNEFQQFLSNINNVYSTMLFNLAEN